MSLSLGLQLASKEMLMCSPSMKDGMSKGKTRCCLATIWKHSLQTGQEMILRNYGAGLISKIGILLRLPQTAIATAQTLMQRFYYLGSLKQYPIKDIVLGTLFLATKVEECPRKIKDIVTICFNLTVAQPEFKANEPIGMTPDVRAAVFP
jgi:cyclin L